MLPEHPIEGNQEAGGSPQPLAQPGQPSADQLAQTMAEIQNRLKAQDAELRALKSGKDRAVDRAVQAMEPMKEQLARMAEYLGVDVSQVQKAQRQIALDSIADEYLNPSQPEPEGTGKGVSVELQHIEAALELPANDSRVTELKLKHGNDPVAFLREATKLKVELATAQSTLTPAEQLLPDGKPASGLPETDAQIKARVLGSYGDPLSPESLKKLGGGAFAR